MGLPSAARLLAGIAQGAILTDRAGNILAVNTGFCELTGYAADEAKGKNPRLLQSGLHDATFYRELWRELLERGQWSGEIWNRRKDGVIYIEWLSIGGVRDAGGRITHWVGVFSDITARKSAEETSRRLGYQDALTGLPNRRMFFEHLRRLGEDRRAFALLFCDIDGFKEINDRLGHAAGDAVLVEVGARLCKLLGAMGIVARLGGDEFGVLAPDLDRVAAAQLAEWLAVPAHGVRLSVGLAVCPDDDPDPVRCLQLADEAMYRDKRAARVRHAAGTPLA